jgi:hypothetical protein
MGIIIHIKVIHNIVKRMKFGPRLNDDTFRVSFKGALSIGGRIAALPRGGPLLGC